MTVRRARPILATVALAVVALMAIGACSRVAAFETSPSQPFGGATLSGVVRGVDGGGRLAGRTIEAIDMRTGGRARAVTNGAGGFTLELPPGHYRVDVSLHDGEVLLARPGSLDISRDSRDRRISNDAIEFVIGPSRTSHPQGPAYSVDNGLGAPIA